MLQQGQPEPAGGQPRARHLCLVWPQGLQELHQLLRFLTAGEEAAGGEVRCVATGHPTGAPRRDCVPAPAASTALLPGHLSAEATKCPGRAVPQRPAIPAAVLPAQRSPEQPLPPLHCPLPCACAAVAAEGDSHSCGGLGPQVGQGSPLAPAGPAEEDVRPWCPLVQDVTELFQSLGAHSPAVCPLGPCSRMPEQEDREQQDPPQEVALEASLNYIYKFLTLCVYSRPGIYTDASLLGLIELLCRTSLDVGLRLLPKTDLQQLLLQLLECIREWPGKLQRLCRTISWVSDHHHNLLAIVQLFLDVTPRARKLRNQLSLVVIARLLGQEEVLPLWKEKSQLPLLSWLLGLMRPSALRQHLGCEHRPPCLEQQPKASAELDQKACCLCHSLLTLAGVVVSSQDVTSDHWGELQLLCMQLDRHINTHIQESPKAMYRTRLKDLATQTYIRWQELLTCCQPKAQYFSPWKDI
ncbi:protein FAM178B isoform X6 [Heterocephalus glaber]|uniref:Protein FAM178B isoform X6 n=1 Tax=Heterocephalus glaber TaxID=10181 RepID=A0AAX6SV72_HETGA|nr:protein FAM178B isoform X6 [Heterocephalus glaber]